MKLALSIITKPNSLFISKLRQKTELLKRLLHLLWKARFRYSLDSKPDLPSPQQKSRKIHFMRRFCPQNVVSRCFVEQNMRSIHNICRVEWTAWIFTFLHGKTFIRPVIQVVGGIQFYTVMPKRTVFPCRTSRNLVFIFAVPPKFPFAYKIEPPCA